MGRPGRLVAKVSVCLLLAGVITKLLHAPLRRHMVVREIAGGEEGEAETNKHNDLSWDEARFSSISHLYDVADVDCLAVLNGDNSSVRHALDTSSLTSWQGTRLQEEFYVDTLEAQGGCEKFVRDRSYITSTLSEQEAAFPLAYSILAHKEAESVERLLRAIYRPQNMYCIHIDKKSKDYFYQAIESIASCFPNVFMAPVRIDVRWAEFSVLEPELNCMGELFRRSTSWKYFINLTGQEFPLKSNRELVEILTAYDGANDVEGVRRRANKGRWEKAGPAPGGLVPAKGSVHVVLNRDVCDFIVNAPLGKELIEWVKPQEVSDETFFSTIVHNPKLGIRGSFVGLDDVETMMERKPWFGRYKSWLDWPCATTRVHDVCILNIGDLPNMHVSPFFFANKFYIRESQVAWGCLEQRLFNSTRDLHLGKRTVDTSIYEDSIIVRNRLKETDMQLEWHKRGSSKGGVERKKNRFGI